MGTPTVTFDPCGHETPQADLDALAELVRRFHVGRAVDVGSWAGSSALAMYDAGASVVHCVDTWQGTPEFDGNTVYLSFQQNVGDLLGRGIRPQRCSSVEAAMGWGLPIDLVFIDADHSYESCLADIRAWTPHVRPGGIVCGHDFSLAGVEQAVRETGPFERAGWSLWWRVKE